MDARTFEALKLSKILSFRREAKAQRIPITDADEVELERRLDAVRVEMESQESWETAAWRS